MVAVSMGQDDKIKLARVEKVRRTARISCEPRIDDDPLSGFREENNRGMAAVR